MDAAQSFRNVPFSSRPASLREFFNLALARLPDRAGLTVLDLGCGTGGLVAMLCDARPDLSITGVDISERSIARAVEEVRSESEVSPTFVAADYITWNAQPFDVILADTVLHLIHSQDDRLIEKLVADLLPGGTLMLSMPVDSLRNRLVSLLRWTWRWTPRSCDALALRLARMVYPRENVANLADRIGYLRILPERLLGDKLVRAFATHGLALQVMLPMADPSIFKPLHRFAVFAKKTAHSNGELQERSPATMKKP